MSASWPEEGPVDVDVLNRADYIVELSRSLRKGIDTTAQAKKVKKDAPPEAGVRANGVQLFIARRYVGWQGSVMQTLSELYQQHGSLPQVRELAAALKSVPELSDNTTFKKVMPFVSSIQKQMETRGIAALALQSPFDEMTLVSSSISFLADQCLIDVANLHIIDAEDESVCALGIHVCFVLYCRILLP